MSDGALVANSTYDDEAEVITISFDGGTATLDYSGNSAHLKHMAQPKVVGAVKVDQRRGWPHCRFARGDSGRGTQSAWSDVEQMGGASILRRRQLALANGLSALWRLRTLPLVR